MAASFEEVLDRIRALTEEYSHLKGIVNSTRLDRVSTYLQSELQELTSTSWRIAITK